MSTEIDKQLERAYELIQQDQFDDALDLLNTVVEENPGESDAWWLMANAVDNPRQARKYLVNCLKHNPKHARARETLDALNEQFPPRDDELLLLMELHDAAPDEDFHTPDDVLADADLFNLFEDEDAEIDLSDLEDLDSLADFDEDDDLFGELLDDDKKDRERQREGGGLRRILTYGLVIVLAALLATVLLMLTGEEEEADTGAADLTPLQAMLPETTELDELVLATQGDAQEQFGSASQALLTQDETGQTLVINSCVCVSADCEGPPVGQLSDIVVESFSLAAEHISQGEAADAVPTAGVNVQACGKSDVVYRAFAPVDSIATYMSDHDLEAFRASWVVIEG